MSTRELTRDDVASMLDVIPADDRDTWVRVAMAAHTVLGDDGRELWLRWSATSEKYNERDARAVWRSLRADGRVGPGTLVHLARAHGWRPGAPVARPACVPAARPEPAQPRLRWSDRAAEMWGHARPLDGDDVASRYLRGRGCVLPPWDGDLRWMLAAPGCSWVSMLARVTDALTGESMTLHRTAIDPATARKADIEDQRLLLRGQAKAGGVIRLWPQESVTYELAIAEGIETGLALAHAVTPVWSTIDAGGMARMPVLSGIVSITIAADNDDAGRRAAEACARRWYDAGRKVRVVLPPGPGQDLADVAALKVQHGR